MEQATLKPAARVRLLAREGIDKCERAGADLLVLAALLMLTEAFGRSFSHVGVDTISLFVTELALVAVLALSLRRHSPIAAVRLVTDRIPVWLFLVFWLTGLVALVRGLKDFGVSKTIEDIGLVEYSILLPIVALAADSASRSELLTRALAFGGIATIVVFGASDITARTWGDTSTLIAVGGIGPGMYMSLYLAWVFARVLHRLHLARVHLAVAPVALVLIGMTDQRGAWLAMAVALIVVAALAPTWRRRALATAAAAVAMVVFVGGAWAVETVLGPLQTPHGEPPTSVQSATGGKGGAQSATGGKGGAQVSKELEAATGGSPGEGANVRWRLAFWGELIRRSVDTPVLGVGFGKPSAFEWRGYRYDFRDDPERPYNVARDDPERLYNVTGPHNDFINLLYRMGVLGLATLVGLLGVAIWRLRALRLTGGDRDHDRARRAALLGMLVSTLAVVSFNDALKGPFLGIFFWTVLGLVLVEGRFCIVEAASGRPATGEEQLR